VIVETMPSFLELSCPVFLARLNSRSWLLPFAMHSLCLLQWSSSNAALLLRLSAMVIKAVFLMWQDLFWNRSSLTARASSQASRVFFVKSQSRSDCASSRWTTSSHMRELCNFSSFSLAAHLLSVLSSRALCFLRHSVCVASCAASFTRFTECISQAGRNPPSTSPSRCGAGGAVDLACEGNF